jgi:hypothetical protein
MGRHGKQHSIGKVKIFMKTLKCRRSISATMTLDEVIPCLSHFIDHVYNQRRLHSTLGCQQFEQRMSAAAKCSARPAQRA